MINTRHAATQGGSIYYKTQHTGLEARPTGVQILEQLLTGCEQLPIVSLL